MFLIDPYRFAVGDAPVSRVAALGSAVTGSPFTLPAHAAGDLLLVFVRSGTTSLPTLPTGYTNIGTLVPTVGNAFRLCWVIDDDNSRTTVAATNANQWGVLVYRGATGIGASQISDSGSGNETATIPALTLTDTSGESWVAAGASLNQARTLSAASGLTALLNNASPELGGGRWAMWDTAAGVASFASRTSTWTGQGSAFWGSWAVEVLT